jgi:hypothetical protein
LCARDRGLPEDDDGDAEATETKPPEVENGGAAIAAITISSFIACMQQEIRDGALQDFSYKTFPSRKQKHTFSPPRDLLTTTSSDPRHTPRRRKCSKKQQQQANSAFFLMLFSIISATNKCNRPQQQQPNSRSNTIFAATDFRTETKSAHARGKKMKKKCYLQRDFVDARAQQCE